MKNIEKTFWEMIANCLAYLLRTKVIWSGIEVIRVRVDMLETKNKILGQAVDAQTQSNKSGYVTEKNARLAALGKRCYKLGRKLTVLAKDTNNAVLLDMVNVSESDMNQTDDKELLSILKNILKCGQDNIAQATAYMITADELTYIEQEIAEVEKLPALVSLVSNDHKAATQAIKQTIKESREILMVLDDAFDGMIEDDVFLNGWYDARKIKGRRNTKKGNDATSNDPDTKS